MDRSRSLFASLALAFCLLTAPARMVRSDPGFDDFEVAGAKAEWDAWLPQIDAAVSSGDKKALAKDLAPGSAITLIYDGQTGSDLLAGDERGWQEALQTLREGQIDTLDQRAEGRGILRRATWRREKDGVISKSREVDARYDSDAGWRIERVLIRDPYNSTSGLRVEGDPDDGN